MRRRFLRRAAGFFAAAALLIVGLSTIVLWAVGTLLGIGRPAWERSLAGPAALAVVVVLILLAGVAARGVFRRMAASFDDLMTALGRVAAGDYSVRVGERGPQEARVLARAFNAMAERLQRQEGQRRRLFTDVSHELRTPLAVLQGTLEGMLDGVYPRDETHLASILEETQVLVRLVEDLRTLSVAESLELKLARAPTDLVELSRDTIASFQAHADAAGITLRLQADPDLPPAEVDAERIHQVLANLLANALRYTPRGGAVTVRCSRGAQGQVVLSVEDTGTGIPPEDLPHVFDRFYKSKDSRGTGLGLAIARSLVTAHGGQISAHGAGGQGTTIRVILPLSPELSV